MGKHNNMGTMDGFTKPLGFETQTPFTTATRLVGIPDNANKAIIQVSYTSVAMRYRDDGAAPTALIGMELEPGDVLPYSGPLDKLQFISQGGAAKINVSYYE